jgi:hypothetical protein
MSSRCVDIQKYNSLLTRCIQVENTLYKIHRDQIAAVSPVFADMFLSGVPQPGGLMDGSIDTDPIEIPGCTAREFDHFLAWMYPAL